MKAFLQRAGCLLLALLPLAAWADPSLVGQWSEVGQWPVSATHAHLLPTGKVMFFGEFDEGLLPPQVWDPETGQLGELPVADYNLFCAGHSFLADGRLLLTGGHADAHVGVTHIRTFNPFTLTWGQGPEMNDNRWYPTNTTLPNGNVMILSGETHGSGMINPLPQVWEAGSNTLRDLVTAQRPLPYYPRMFLAPNGKLFLAGPWRVSRWLDPEGTGTWYSATSSLHGGRDYGAAVMYDTKVLIVGGGRPPTETAEEIDLAAPSPTWRYVAPMHHARRQLNATLLPDGTTLVTGGSGGDIFDDATQPILHPEVYEPATDTWTRLAPAAEFRGYHSTALLLPDGRVLTGGGRHRQSMELFSPPYLFKGPRPTVSHAPGAVMPREIFRVETPDAARVDKVTLLALGSVTHAFDQHQRLVTLSFSRSAGGLEVTAPESNIAAPPGFYMLFLVDSSGVPSVAHMVRVGVEVPRFREEIVFSDVWKYDDRGLDHGNAWLARDFDDSAWKSGPGQLGYGSGGGDEGTVVDRGEPTRPTVYFRKKFTLDTPISAANLEVLYDDGIAVWINGVHVLSRNMARGLDHGAWASGSVTDEFERVSLPLSPNPFRLGENVVTAMVKQVSPTSTDLTFALALELEPVSAPASEALTVTAPNGGEGFQPGDSTSITWSTLGAVPRVDLAWSADGGARWTDIASGVENTGVYAWTVPDASTSQALVRVSHSGGGSPSDVSDAPFIIRRATLRVAIPYGSVWKYEDSGLEPGPEWSQLHFDDSAWRSGPGKLGYGRGDEATVLTRTSPSQTSVYFRKRLTVDGPIIEARLRVLYDDGFVVYVNGSQVLARNVDSGIAHGRYASASVDDALAEESISTAPFVQGENIIAVMVKQVGRTSPDLAFELELELGTLSGQ